MRDEAVTPTPPITVSICEDLAGHCQSDTCEHSADLVITVPDDTADVSEQPCCVNHWGAIRREFVRSGRTIHYGEGAPELIVERLSTRLVKDGAGVPQ
jgi:hypothetical protein